MPGRDNKDQILHLFSVSGQEKVHKMRECSTSQHVSLILFRLHRCKDMWRNISGFALGSNRSVKTVLCSGYGSYRHGMIIEIKQNTRFSRLVLFVTKSQLKTTIDDFRANAHCNDPESVGNCFNNLLTLIADVGL